MASQGLQTKGPINSGTTRILLPDGAAEGDTLVWDHANKTWITVDAPVGMTRNPALRFNLETGRPYWEEPDDC